MDAGWWTWVRPWPSPPCNQLAAGSEQGLELAMNAAVRVFKVFTLGGGPGLGDSPRPRGGDCDVRRSIGAAVAPDPSGGYGAGGAGWSGQGRRDAEVHGVRLRARAHLPQHRLARPDAARR